GDGGLWRRTAVTLTAAPGPESWAVDGVVRHVLNGAVADDLVVVATTAGEPAVFLVDPNADGVVVETERVLDGTRPMASITFTGAPAIRLSGDGPVDGGPVDNVI